MSDSNPSSPMRAIARARHVQKRPLMHGLWCAFTLVSMPALADVVADGSAGPAVSQLENQATRIDINAPNDEGVSHNTYQHFDVDKAGAVLNNSRGESSTELAGRMTGNPHLGEHEARVIINEVISHDPSRLNGMLEVAGQRADVIVANPAGITCAGCGFINSDRGVLTTGTPVMEDGQLTGFDVKQGEIAIEGEGLKGQRQRYTDVIARAVRLNANIHADQLHVTTGANHVDAEYPEDTVEIKGEGEKPTVALDVSAIGGMYANSIYIKGTEAGLGVRNAGSLEAGRENIVLSNNGTISNTGFKARITSVSDIDIDTHGHDFDNTRGWIYTHSLTLDADEGTITNVGGSIKGTGKFSLSASNVDNTRGHISTWVVNDRKRGPRRYGTGEINTDNLDNESGVISAKTLLVKAFSDECGGGITNERGAIYTDSILTVDMPNGTLNNDDGRIKWGGSYKTLDMSLASLSNIQGWILNKTGRGEDGNAIRLSGHLDNENGILSGIATINAESINNARGRILDDHLESPTTMTLNTGDVNNAQGWITGKNLVLNTKTLNNEDGVIGTRELPGVSEHDAGHDRTLYIDTHGHALNNRSSNDDPEYKSISAKQGTIKASEVIGDRNKIADTITITHS